MSGLFRTVSPRNEIEKLSLRVGDLILTFFAVLQHFLYPVSVMIITVAANRHIVNPQFEKLNKGHDKLNKGLKRLELKLEKHCQAEKDKIDRLTQVVDKVKEDVIEVKHDLEKLQDRIDTKHSAIPVEGMVIA